MNEVFFTIIIPTYNSSSSIGDSLDSIYHNCNGKTNFEVIVVDDGSTDNTEDVLKAYKTSRLGLTVLKQENSGPNVARNYALSKSKGSHVLFLDSDDVFKAGFLDILYETIKKDNPCVINFGYEFYDTEAKRVISASKYKCDSTLKGYDILKSSLLSNGISGVCWNKCIRRDVISNNDIFFYPDKMHGRDILFTRQVAYFSRRAVIKNNILVSSQYRHGSFSRSFGKNNLLSAVDLVDKHLDFFSGNLTDERMQDLKFALDRHLAYILVLSSFRVNNYREFFEYSGLIKVESIKYNFSYNIIFNIMVFLVKQPKLLWIVSKLCNKLGYKPY